MLLIVLYLSILQMPLFMLFFYSLSLSLYFILIIPPIFKPPFRISFIVFSRFVHIVILSLMLFLLVLCLNQYYLLLLLLLLLLLRLIWFNFVVLFCHSITSFCCCILLCFLLIQIARRSITVDIVSVVFRRWGQRRGIKLLFRSARSLNTLAILFMTTTTWYQLLMIPCIHVLIMLW